MSEIQPQSIVFIQDKRLIWTHNAFYGEVPEGGSDGIKHVILSLSEYDQLREYDNDAIYFIINKDWTFGGTFPITFGQESELGTFPVKLT